MSKKTQVAAGDRVRLKISAEDSHGREFWRTTLKILKVNGRGTEALVQAIDGGASTWVLIDEIVKVSP